MQNERDKLISHLMQELSKITGSKSLNWTNTKYQEIWDACSEWNRTHYGDGEIFMCEDEDEDGNFRVYVEDDYFTYFE